MTGGRDRQVLRERVLRASLTHVPFDGWTRRALMAGARDAGFDEADADRAFPGGLADAVDLYVRLADADMLDALDRLDLASMKVRERIAAAIRIRLTEAAPQRQAVRAACAFLAMPQNAGLAVRSLYRTVDAIWRAAGDTSTDYNFYTKRMLLAGVYSSTLLYWLNDDSPGFADTWGFLDRRIEDVMRVPRAAARVKQLAGRLPDPFRLLRRRRA